MQETRTKPRIIGAWGPASPRPSLLGAREAGREGEEDVGHALARCRLAGRWAAETHGRPVVLAGRVQMPAQGVARVVGHGRAERRACGGGLLGVVAAENARRV